MTEKIRKTSNAAKQRYNEKTYSRLEVKLYGIETAAKLKNKALEEGTTANSLINKWVSQYLQETER